MFNQHAVKQDHVFRKLIERQLAYKNKKSALKVFENLSPRLVRFELQANTVLVIKV